MIGGISSKGKVLDDIWNFNMAAKTWYKCRVDYKDAGEYCEDGVAQHSACLVRGTSSDRKNPDDGTFGFMEGLYIFGGRNEFAEANNDLRILKIAETPMKFIKAATKGIPPAPRGVP